jgi:hypothetical protein
VKFNSGFFEALDEDGSLATQGTYTTNDGKTTSTITHLFGTLFGLDSRWYTQDELEKYLGYQLSELFNPRTREYTVNGNIITEIYDDGETNTMTLVSQDGKFTSAADSDKKPASVAKSSGSASALAGRWYLDEGPSYRNPEEMDLLKDGTGIVDGLGVTWNIENGRFYLINPVFAFSSIYNVSGSTLKLTTDDGDILIYKKR